MRGRVKFYNGLQGYGFIVCKAGREYYVDARELNHDEGYARLEAGEEVEFTPSRTGSSPGKKPLALDVLRLSPPVKTERLRLSTNLKANPFTPQSPVTDPSRFAGREDAVLLGIDALFNNSNLLISGERGVGKSSLANQLQLLVEGDCSLLERLKVTADGFVFQYVAASYVCSPGDSLKEMVLGLLTSLYARVGWVLGGQRTSEASLKLKVIELTESIQRDDFDIANLPTAVVEAVSAIVQAMPVDFNGISLLIDEVDVLPEDTPIAPFFKATHEAMRKRGIMNVSYIVAGVSGVMTNLLRQHASSSRLFMNIDLPRMNEFELRELIDKALDGTGVSIVPRAASRIVGKADRFPAPVQLLGYYSFNCDTDDCIDVKDVTMAEHVVITQIKAQEFSGVHELATGGPRIYERILTKMSALPNSVTMTRLASSVHMLDDDLEPYVKTLIERDVLVEESSGNIRFKDPLFKIYYQWVLKQH